MGTGVAVRRATPADAAAAVDTLRRSITELCGIDHRHDPAAIAGWLGNKTEESWHSWTARDDAVVLVAEREGRVAGVGMATLAGEILLNYVHPEARFDGVSKAILAALEGVLRDQGVERCWLDSTRTALTFYKACGFRPEGDAAQRLCKVLAPIDLPRRPGFSTGG